MRLGSAPASVLNTIFSTADVARDESRTVGASTSADVLSSRYIYSTGIG